jgi:peptidoglycan/LPS O-acetylase OafA/YrhL
MWSRLGDSSRPPPDPVPRYDGRVQNTLGGNEIGNVRFHFLDAVRGLAALWVVLDHVSNYAGNLKASLNHYVYTWVFDIGRVGPVVFFVLSGYVISHSIRNNPQRGRDARTFTARRWMRLSPPYYAAVVLAIVVSYVASKVKDEAYTIPSVADLIAHLFYVPDLLNWRMVNGVHWTLYLEVQFYALLWVFQWVFVRLRARQPIAAWAWLAAAAGLSVMWPVFGLLQRREHWFGPYVYTFLLGVLLYWARRNVVPRWIATSFLALVGIGWIINKDVLAGGAFITGLLIWAAESGDRMESWLRARPFQVLGAISFSLYLTHSPIMGVTNWAGIKLIGDTAGAQAAMVIPYLVVSVVFGWVAWWLIERPAIEWSRRIGAPRRGAAVAAQRTA